MASDHPISNALTVDLEEYFQVSNFEHVIDRGRWEHLPSRVEASTHDLLDTFDHVGHRATFFVLGWVAERARGLVREIAERGHEIACHGYGHQLVYAIGPDRFRADLRRARAAIQDATGLGVEGYRAPSYSITRDSLWALEILVEEGFRFDSSIFPVRHPRYGIPDFSRHPVRLQLSGGGSILEYPMTTYPLGRLTLPVAGGAYLRFLPPTVMRWALGRLMRNGEPTVLYVHPWEVDDGQPRQAVSWKTRVNHYYNLDRTLPRLRRLLELGPFAPMGQVLANLEAAGALGDHPPLAAAA